MLGTYDPKGIEPKWQRRWEELGIHRFDERDVKRPIYSIDSPPPFTSGDLHMGHVLSYAYFDFAARYRRMAGFNVFYPQGWDCQGFPTEVKVEAKYGRRLRPEEFRKRCVEWTEEYIKRMRGQMVAMGFSPDWRYEYKTMAPEYHRKVQLSLLRMYENGLVYRAEHPVFWCTHCASAIAKAETEEYERSTELNFIIFATDATHEKHITIATTRPELLHACVAIFVNPNDDRYRELVGKTARVPLYGREVKIMADPDVDPTFGTGIVMMCTFGDKQDVVWTYRHGLEPVRAMDEHGRLLNAGEFTGKSVEEAKKEIIEKLRAEGLVVKQEKLVQRVKIHDRCSRPIELMLSKQWFIRLKGFEESVKAAARAMRWIPEFTLQYLIDWANYIEWDWVISRDRIFGTPLPFWNCRKCGEIVTPSESQLPVYPQTDPAPLPACPKCGGELEGEKATCDCWVDSSISPLIISGWPENEGLHALIYPATLRPQGTEIIRTWAFYTIYRCLQLTGKPPFKEVLINGMVLAPDGKKMSKSLGNVISPDRLLEQYGADAIRQWVALSGALAKDRPFSYKDIQHARLFLNKLWNAGKFVEKALEGFDMKGVREAELKLRPVDRWMLSRISRLVRQNTEGYDNYDYFAVITSLHEFFWHEFCDFYLEEVKHRLYQPEKYGAESKRAAQFTLYTVMLETLRMLAPIAPHICEELHQELFAKSEGRRSICAGPWPKCVEKRIDADAEKSGELLKAVLAEVRKFKAGNRLPLNADVSLVRIRTPEPERVEQIREELEAAGRARKIEVSRGDFKVEVQR
mgnify:CR=1 FL=1